MSAGQMFCHTFMRHMYDYGTKPEQVADNIGAVELQLTTDVVAALDAIFPGPEALSNF